jgi:hypothetical protein
MLFSTKPPTLGVFDSLSQQSTVNSKIDFYPVSYSNRHIGEDINNFMNRADTRTASMV